MLPVNVVLVVVPGRLRADPDPARVLGRDDPGGCDPDPRAALEPEEALPPVLGIPPVKARLLADMRA